MGLRFERGDRACERDLGAQLESGQTFRCERQRAVVISALLHQAEADQFAANDFPFRAAVLAANAIGRGLFVFPFADILSISARQDFRDLINPKIKAALLTHSVDAGEKLLRGESSIVSLTRRN